MRNDKERSQRKDEGGGDARARDDIGFLSMGLLFVRSLGREATGQGSSEEQRLFVAPNDER